MNLDPEQQPQTIELVNLKHRKQRENEDLLGTEQDGQEPFSVASGSTNVSVNEGANDELRTSTPDEDPK
jgi:hypothetical protein